MNNQPVGTRVIEATADGSQTIRDCDSGETYHSVNGAIAESDHIFIRNGLDECRADPVRILEAGMGTGLNALLTLKRSLTRGRKVEYTAIELYPLDMEIIRQMELASNRFFVALHEAPWEVVADITGSFKLLKTRCDLAEFEPCGIFDLVYFDAFSPATQPRLWTESVFARIFGALSPGGMLVTYCAKGDVKRALRSVGFEVQRLQGAPGKRHMLRAVKSLKD